ncbi:MAG: hypothetical protein NTV80_00810 [Verrucomicrobia bacterium]|nr:hypothetical protein [Verrucomicrobiota bacterium]
MKLEQGQIWKQGEVYYRIVEWARMYIEYKQMKDPATKEGTFHQLSKKEFCRLLKGATLIPNTKKADEEDELSVEDDQDSLAELQEFGAASDD